MKNLKLNLMVVVFACLALSACKKDQASVDLGKEYGQSKTIKDCNNRSFQILEKAGLDDGYSTTPHDFAFGCSLTAANDKGYCKDIPVASVFQSVKWMEEQCADHSDTKACKKILKHSVGRCISEREVNVESKDSTNSDSDRSPTI